MKIRDILKEADPAELGPMNDKMKSVLDKVHAGDKVQAKADAEAKAKADAEKAAKQQAEDDKIIAFAKKHGFDLEPKEISYFQTGLEHGKRGYVDRGAGEAYGPYYAAYAKGVNIGEKMKDSGIDEASEPGEYRTIRGVKYYIVKNKSGKSKGFSGPTPAAKKYAQSGGGRFEDIDEMSAGNVASSMGGGNGFVNGIGTTQRRGTSSKKKRRKSKS